MTEVPQKKVFNEDGSTLLEILVGLAILSILAAFALANFSKPKTQLQRQESARRLKTYLERARFDSIKRRASLPVEMAKITIDSPNSYTLARDLNEDGTLAATEIFPVTLSPNNNFKIVGNFTSFPITVRFNFRGQMTATDGANLPVDPVFTICDADCTLATATVENSSVVAVSPSGTVSLLTGGKSPAIAVPVNVANVNTGQQINQDGIVGN